MKLLREIASVLSFVGAFLVPYTGDILPATRALLLGAACLTPAICIAILGLVAKSDDAPRGTRSKHGNALVILISLACVLKIGLDLMDGVRWADVKLAVIDVLFQLLMLGSGIALAVNYRNEAPRKAVAIVGMALAIYSAINVVGFFMGIRPPQESQIDSLMGLNEGRMLAPFGPGLNNFANLAALGMGLCVAMAFESIRERAWLWTLGTVVGGIAAGISVALTEMRSALVGLLLVLVWSMTRRLKVRMAVTVGACAMLVLLPVLSKGQFLMDQISNLIPSFTLDRMQRQEGEFGSLNGRVFVWDSGLSELLQGESPLIGAGSRARDTREILFAQIGTLYNHNTTYHNALLDNLIVYGWLAGGLAWIGVFLTVGKATTFGADAGMKDEGQLDMSLQLLMVGLIASGIFEAISMYMAPWALIWFAAYRISSGDMIRVKPA